MYSKKMLWSPIAVGLYLSSAVGFADPTIHSCLREATVAIQFDTAGLQRAGRSDALPANINEVKLHVSQSFIRTDDDMVYCGYKSQNGDVFNLVYKFKCKDAYKANNGYDHAYFCN